MKSRLFIILSIVMTLALVTGIAVSASADNVDDTQLTVTEPQIQKTEVIKDKTYFAYYNTGSGKGAVALCFDNLFTACGESTEDIRLCTKNEDGTYNELYTISRENIKTLFAGKQEYSVNPSENLSELLGGLSGVGITLDSTKTNLIFALNSQSIEKGKTYYVYIPEDYYADADGVGNLGAYIEIEGSAVNSYTGTICGDFETIANGIYDAALFGLESLASLVS